MFFFVLKDATFYYDPQNNWNIHKLNASKSQAIIKGSFNLS